MITTRNGETKATGNIPELLADFACITRSLFEGLSPKLGEEKTKELLEENFKRAFMTEEGLKESTKEKVDELKNFLRSLANLLEDETEEEGDQ